MQAQEVATLIDMPVIPAMTTEAERSLFYRLALDAAPEGAVIELGAWLGASSAWIAAAMRDSGTGSKAHIYDRFLSKPGHASKVRNWLDSHAPDAPMPMGDCFDQFRANLGPLMDHVEAHQGEIDAIKWTGGPISLIVNDAPKRIPQISTMLTTFGPSLRPGAVMAWQDFCHFPSYEIAACLYRLRDHFEFVEAAVPGTTLAFRVVKPWTREQVSRDALSLDRWKLSDVQRAWTHWLEEGVPTEKASLFRCGAAMFLCDIGMAGDGSTVLKQILSEDAQAVVPKWIYLYRNRADFVKRYAGLFDVLKKQSLL